MRWLPQRFYQMMAHYYEDRYPEVFEPVSLTYRPKKQQPATAKQKAYLNELVKYHKIDFNQDAEMMTKSEMSRVMTKLFSFTAE